MNNDDIDDIFIFEHVNTNICFCKYFYYFCNRIVINREKILCNKML